MTQTKKVLEQIESLKAKIEGKTFVLSRIPATVFDYSARFEAIKADIFAMKQELEYLQVYGYQDRDEVDHDVKWTGKPEITWTDDMIKTIETAYKSGLRLHDRKEILALANQLGARRGSVAWYVKMFTWCESPSESVRLQVQTRAAAIYFSEDTESLEQIVALQKAMFN